MSAGLVGALVAYVIGSIPFALIVHRYSGHGDLRAQGSGNIGATNVFRSGSRAAGIVTLVLDIGKGIAGVAAARYLGAEGGFEGAAAFAAVVGHCHPVWLKFRGGKGIATGCGAFGLLAPLPMGLALAAFLISLVVTRMVSVGSLVGGVTLPLAIFWLQPGGALLIWSAAAVLLATIRHHENLRRILRGSERRVATGEKTHGE